ncbi:MAG: substrate-binding domain-containing protein, partial [Granulosicoccus sp.]
VLASCAEHGPRVGHDIRVIGFDDIEDCLDSFPSLTSVSCNIPEFADTAAKSMLNWINDDKAPDSIARLSVSLIRRASTASY